MSENRGIAPFPEDYDNVKRGHNYFVGIGINTYQHFTKLHNARKDVEDVADLLCESFHFERKHMTLLLDDDATRKRIIKTISDLRHKISEDDSLLIYYSGHGFMSGGLGYWIPIEAAKDEEDEFVSNSDIRDKIKEIKARHTLLISDSCFSASLLVRDASREVSGSFDTWEKQKSRWVVISGKGIVSDGEQGKNSPFANAILKNLKNASDDKINIVKLADEVTKSVGYNYEQQAECSPLFGVGHDGGQFVFHKTSQEAPAWAAACAKNQVVDYEFFIQKFPTSLFAKEAAQRIEKLKETAAWQKALQRNTETAFLDYLQQFPHGANAASAKQKMHDIAEEQKWQIAKRRDSLIAYIEYKDAYPKGKYVAEADDAMTAIRQRDKQQHEAAKIAGQAQEAKIAEQQQRETELREAAEKARLEKAAAEAKEKEERERKEAEEKKKESEKIAYRIESQVNTEVKPSFFYQYRFALGGAALFLVFMLIWKYSGKDTNENNANTSSANQIQVPNFDMVYVEGGTFKMGSNNGEEDEKPVHKVTLSSFNIGKYEVTQTQWKAIMGNNPSKFQNCDDCPVENVSWYDIEEFLKKLNQKTGKNYSLPTEAEWEYAARGGKQSKGYEYAGSDTIDNVAQYDGNNNKSTKSVGSKSPNELGIYDMSGNVWEWCNDLYDENYYKNSPANNPTGATEGKYRVLRGGSWLNSAAYCRVASRSYLNPAYRDVNFGFRLCLRY